MSLANANLSLLHLVKFNNIFYYKGNIRSYFLYKKITSANSYQL